jgi:hypothetical protein
MAEHGGADQQFAAPHICAIHAGVAEVENRFDLSVSTAN